MAMPSTMPLWLFQSRSAWHWVAINPAYNSNMRFFSICLPSGSSHDPAQTNPSNLYLSSGTCRWLRWDLFGSLSPRSGVSFSSRHPKLQLFVLRCAYSMRSRLGEYCCWWNYLWMWKLTCLFLYRRVRSAHHYQPMPGYEPLTCSMLPM